MVETRIIETKTITGKLERIKSVSYEFGILTCTDIAIRSDEQAATIGAFFYGAVPVEYVGKKVKLWDRLEEKKFTWSTKYRRRQELHTNEPIEPHVPARVDTVSGDRDY